MNENHSIKEMNYVIGIFDGRGFSMSHITDYTAENAPHMKYHRSWDWIMRVIGKINNLVNNQRNMIKKQKMTQRIGPIELALLKGSIKDVHYWVYNFIVWHRENKNKLTNK
jgi:hypothetical protein